LDGTDHASHHQQASMIRRYIAWRNRNAHDRRLRESSTGQRLPDASLVAASAWVLVATWCAVHSLRNRPGIATAAGEVSVVHDAIGPELVRHGR
jgi:hypothetical protein